MIDLVNLFGAEKLTRVLMLGWEFPPLLSGGLGIATQGIVTALSGKVNVTLILPRAVRDSENPKFNILGVNNLSADEKCSVRSRLSEAATVYEVPMAISPYHFINELLLNDGQTSHERKHHHTQTLAAAQEDFMLLDEPDLYGPAILKKVELYAALVFTLSERLQFDVIHAHDWMTFQAGIRLREVSGKPVILHVHALETDRSGPSAFNDIYRLEQRSLAQADGIIAVSQYTKQQIVDRYGIPADKITVVYNGIEPRVAKRKAASFRETTVLFLGRITHQKGPAFLLETIHKVVKVYPRIKFLVAGTGDQFAPLLVTAAHRRLGRHIIFTGFLDRNKVDELLSIADVYFMPSVSEPFGLTALEAAQFGLPCILSAESGVAEVLHSSLRASHWDTDAYANYIYALCRYPALRTELTRHAEQELQKITWTRAADVIVNLYNRVLSLTKNSYSS